MDGFIFPALVNTIVQTIIQNGEHEPGGAGTPGWRRAHGVRSGGDAVPLQPLLAHADRATPGHALLRIRRGREEKKQDKPSSDKSLILYFHFF